MPDYSMPSWQQGNPGVTIPETIQRSRAMRQQQAQQMFERALQTQEWQQKQALYQQQAAQVARRYAAQQNLNKAVSEASKLPAGSPERSAAVNAAYLQFGVDAGVGSAAMAAAIRGSQPAKPAPTLQPVTVPGAANPKTMPSPGFTAQMNDILKSSGKSPITPVAPPQAWAFGNRLITGKELGIAPPAIPHLPEGSKYVPEKDGTPAHWETPKLVKTAPAGTVTQQTRLKISGLQKAQTRLQKEMDNLTPDSPRVTALVKSGMAGSAAMEAAEKAIQDEIDAKDAEIESLESGGEGSTKPTETSPKAQFRWENGDLVPVK